MDIMARETASTRDEAKLGEPLGPDPGVPDVLGTWDLNQAWEQCCWDHFELGHEAFIRRYNDWSPLDLCIYFFLMSCLFILLPS
ncbi:hypothetical protein V6N11_022096 [Hibiscus sabdariffa]|uniref:Uncharacterized protein n=1 Tax=Hibiscus sabdariffa TaxID=183260 RepID=A0ABR2TIS1_9ROSI